MRNNLKKILLIVVLIINFQTFVYSDDQFIFNVTEIEILKNGNQINGYKGGVVTTEKGEVIKAENFFYNKINNILNAKGNVTYTNIKNNSTIISDNITYFKNEEKIVTKGNSKAIDNKNIITANEFNYDKLKNVINAKKNVEIEDLEKDIKIFSDDITYFKNEEKIVTKGNSKAIDNKNIITANEFNYDKLKNVINAKKNVEIEDLEKDIKIFSDDITYFKNEEKIVTKGNSKAIDNKNIITANEFNYDKLKNVINAKKNVEIEDLEKDIKIFSDDITYFKNEEKIVTKGNSKAIDNKNIITANEFNYDKLKNVINAKKNVEIEDLEKDIKIFSDDITYFKNEEKIVTFGFTEANIEDEYNFVSSDVTFLRNTLDLSSNNTTTIKDNFDSVYNLDKFRYTINNKLLKAKNLKIITKNENEKKDNYFFSEGIFNLENKKFISKETEIKIHKDVFGNKNNDPRFYGASASGDKDKTIVNKGVFTSCKNTHKITPWCIKANKITHDKINKNLIYENATLKIYDVPVIYFPKFFHPDPTVKRRTGFLQPQFNNSETLGSSIHIPYYKTLNDDKDYTFKPTIFEDNKYILQNEFRRKFKNASLISDFSLTRGYKSSSSDEKNSIGHLFAS